MHGFSDAAQNAYGACVYVRSIEDQSKIQVRLLCSKIRVAPLKSQTISRLELCAALTLARLMTKINDVVNSLNVAINRIIYWSDSTIVLNWLQTQPSTLQVFVANRVAEIQELTDCSSWRHVPTKENPADLLSRGLFPEQLLQSIIWWHGPSFLSRPEHERPTTHKPEISTTELKKTVCTVKQTHPVKSFIFGIATNSSRLIRIVAYCKRFVNNCRNQSKNKLTFLTTAELKDSLYGLAKLAQRESFPTETKILREGGSITKGKLAALDAFLDQDDIIQRRWRKVKKLRV